MRPLPLRTRLLMAVGLVAVLQIVVAGVVITTTRRQMIDQLDQRLDVATADGRPGRSGDSSRGPGNVGDGNGGGNNPPAPDRLGDSYEGILTSDGTLLTFFAPNSTGRDLEPPQLTTEQAASSRGKPITVDAQSGDHRYRLATTSVDGGWFVSAIPLDGVEATMRRLITVVALAALGVTMALGLVTWWVVRLGIAPIKRMTSTAEAIAAGDLSERIGDVDPGTEAGQLGAALNTMLSQIETSFDERTRAEGRLRQFIADASHELRTPVATIRGYAELYQVGGLAERSELDDAMRRTEQESQRMSRLITDMLNLAKLDRDPMLATTAVDLTGLARDAAADAQATHPERTIGSSFPDGPLGVEGDEDLLRQMLANLVGNAVVHTDPAATVMVSTRRIGTDAVLEVIDTGDGMTPEVVERVTERFFRADPSRSRHKGGSGLGLAIVDSVIDAHHGTLSIESEPGTGTTMTVTIPLRDQGV